MKFKVMAMKCLLCGDTIFSRARHDYVMCSCGQCSIDGGPTITEPTQVQLDQLDSINIVSQGCIKKDLVKYVSIELDSGEEHPKIYLYNNYNSNGDVNRIIDSSYDLLIAKAKLQLYL